MENFYEKLTIHTERGRRAVEKAIEEEKEAKKEIIREKMKEIKKINELEEGVINNCRFLSEVWDKELKRYEELKEKRKEILTELNYLAK